MSDDPSYSDDETLWRSALRDFSQARAALVQAVRWLEAGQATLFELDYRMRREPNRARGGRARAAALTPERRSEIASKAARTRWARKRDREFGQPHYGHDEERDE
jgi:hypothetical protein